MHSIYIDSSRRASDQTPHNFTIEISEPIFVPKGSKPHIRLSNVVMPNANLKVPHENKDEKSGAFTAKTFEAEFPDSSTPHRSSDIYGIEIPGIPTASDMKTWGSRNILLAFSTDSSSGLWVRDERIRAIGIPEVDESFMIGPTFRIIITSPYWADWKATLEIQVNGAE